MVEKRLIQNPHLEGGPFFWQGGEVGVVLCHGYTATAAEVRPLAKILHQHGYTVAGPLLPGHGTGPGEMNRYRWQDWAAALEATYLEVQARCQQVFLGGESMGALLTLYLAAQHPEISGLLLYAPALKVASPSTAFLAPILAPFVPYWHKQEGTPRASDALWQGYTVNPVRAVVQLLQLQKAVAHRLPTIRQPLMIIHGREDLTVDPQSPEIIFRQVQSKVTELHWLDRSGHCVMLDCELDRVTHLTLTFLESCLYNSKPSKSSEVSPVP